MTLQGAVAVSVVIPAHNRRALLREVLAAAGAQAGAPPFEIVVVDDGSTDGSSEGLEDLALPVPLRVVRQPNRGPAAARNRGVAAARGALVAFLGDDTVPAPDWLAWHVEAHHARAAATPLAVIGRTEWHPRIRPTRFLAYINEQGLQFGYALIDRPEQVPFNFFYTSNLSLTRSALLEEPFDETFPYAAWEDIEASYRLTRRGLRLVYEARARVFHDHPTSFARFCSRQERVGYSAVVFWRRHPELGPFLGLGPDGPPPLPPRGRQRRLEWLVQALQKLPVSLPTKWEEGLRYHYLRGLHRGWSELVASPERSSS